MRHGFGIGIGGIHALNARQSTRQSCRNQPRSESSEAEDRREEDEAVDIACEYGLAAVPHPSGGPAPADA